MIPDEILDCWGLSGYAGGAIVLGSGNIHDTYRLGSFVIQRLNNQIFRDPELVMDNLTRVLDHLCGGPYPLQVSRPVVSASGNMLEWDSMGGVWRVFSYISDTYAPEGMVSAETAREAAWAYGVFTAAMDTFGLEGLGETIPGFHDSDRRWTQFTIAIERDIAFRMKDCSREIGRMRDYSGLFERVGKLKRSGELVLRVTHNDTKAGNVLMSLHTGRAVAVIDLDTVMPGVVLSDFGDMVRTFVPSVYEDGRAEDLSLRLEVLDALRAGYLSSAGGVLTPLERQNLFLGGAWMVGEQALRFLTDYLNGDLYYKTAYDHHNLVRARNQLRLLDLLSGLSGW
jgi:hypothetical protein